MIELNHPGQLSFHEKHCQFDVIELSLYPFNGQKMIKFSFRFIQPEAAAQEEIAYAGLPSAPEDMEYLLAIPSSIEIHQDASGFIRFQSDDGGEARLELALDDLFVIRGLLHHLTEAPPPGPSVV